MNDRTETMEIIVNGDLWAKLHLTPSLVSQIEEILSPILDEYESEVTRP